MRCADGKERPVPGRLPGSFVERYRVYWAEGTTLAALAGSSNTALEPGAPVTLVEAGALDLGSLCGGGH